jgi:hypothetical protein
VVCTFDQIAWFRFRNDEIVWILGRLAGGISKANKYLPGNYDFIIDYFFCYTLGGSGGKSGEHRAL